jgi:transcriptional regulator with XRE-family HTH domain
MSIEQKRIPPFIVWNRLRALREEKGLSMARVANDAGVSAPTLWLLEQGFDERTTIQTKKKLADYFKCSVSDIFPVKMLGDQTLEAHIANSLKKD